jgi:hypothetical protein
MSANVSEVHTASIFMVDMCKLGDFVYVHKGSRCEILWGIGGLVLHCRGAVCLIKHHIMNTFEGMEEYLHAFLTRALNIGEWSALCPDCFTLRKTAPDAHWIGAVWVHTRSGQWLLYVPPAFTFILATECIYGLNVILTINNINRLVNLM